MAGVCRNMAKLVWTKNTQGDANMDELKVLSRRVKMIRLDHSVSQTDMAKAIGVSQTNLSNMEAGRTAITVQNLFKIQKVLGWKMADFFVDFDGEMFHWAWRCLEYFDIAESCKCQRFIMRWLTLVIILNLFVHFEGDEHKRSDGYPEREVYYEQDLQSCLE